MEERIEYIMYNVHKLVITGAESTGKTTLAIQLSKYFNDVYVHEYAREYVENLKRKYNYTDLEFIAQKQLDNIKKKQEAAKKYVFIDTSLIIIKIWFKEVFQKYPEWIDKKIRDHDVDLYLLCDIDLPWKPDPVRENGGKNRETLHKLYIEQLDYYNLPYAIVKGWQENRFNNAIQIVNTYFK